MVKKLSGKGIKTLKFFHLLFVSMWFGGGVTLTLFFQNLEKLSIGGLIQLILVIFLIYISVFKPWK
jgi:hypothetical protein